MRQFGSITAILALAFSMMSPMLMSGMEPDSPAACHRSPIAAQEHAHCTGMEHRHPAQSSTERSIGADGHSQDCPMNCCTQSVPPNSAAPAAISTSPSLLVVNEVLHLNCIIFLSAGFSSHTDRGPPAL